MSIYSMLKTDWLYRVCFAGGVLFGMGTLGGAYSEWSWQKHMPEPSKNLVRYREIKTTLEGRDLPRGNLISLLNQEFRDSLFADMRKLIEEESELLALGVVEEHAEHLKKEGEFSESIDLARGYTRWGAVFGVLLGIGASSRRRRKEAEAIAADLQKRELSVRDAASELQKETEKLRGGLPVDFN